MTRSVWKSLHMSFSLLKKCNTFLETYHKWKILKLYDRSSMIPLCFESHKVLIHNGMTFIPLVVSADNCISKFGEYSRTRVRCVFKKADKVVKKK